MKTITSSSVLSLRDAHDQIKQCIQLIESKQAEPNCDKLYAHIIIRKLDKEGIQLYEQYIKKPREINTLKDVFEFLEQQFQTLEAQNSLKTSRINYINPPTDIRIQNNTIQCQCCNQLGHRMYNCKRFMDMSIGQRTSLIRNKQLCEICLSHNNRIKCNSTHKCKKCNKAHNSLLHMEYNLNQRQQNSRNNPKINKEGKTYSTIIKDKKQLTLLPTVLISTKSSDGNIHQLRALVDQGSQVSIVSEKVVQLLILKKMKHMTKLSGVSNTTVGTSNARVFMEISSRFSIKKKIKGEFLVMSHLVRSLPEETIEIETKIWDNYKLADPEFNKNGCIDMIIGSDLYPKIIKEGIKKYNNLIGQETIFGWMISGQILADAASNDVISTLNLERFWEIEEIENEKEIPNSDDELCLDLYKTTTIKDTDGRYIVQIPFKEDLSLGNSRKQAVARLLSLEKNINKKLKKEYVEFMREYEQLGHMVKTKDQNKGLYYMPHQAVIREKSLTTKLRVVFDASAKTSNGKSLNNIMMTGPRLQKDIFDIILKWRLWRFVVTADVEKMFRQIKITKEHQDYQRILWRENQTDKIEEFKLTTVTYGTASAAFLAVRTLQQIAGDYEGNVNIKNTIKNDFYMDDLLTGADTTSDCKDKINKIFNCLNSAGFKLRKWMSNNQSILENVPIEVSNKILNIKEDDSIKTLGLKWNPREDEFQFSINILTNDRITKRMVLSVNAKIFDPLGWLTPVTITAKLFIQKLWQLKYDWDEILDEQVHKEYEKNNKNIQIIEQTRIPRWMEVSSLDNWELHGFSDASEAAYAAAIYIKIGSKINLLTAKSKVAPIKNKKTIPKLELCGAHLLAKLMNKIIKILGNNPEVYCWSDSAITLWWIKEPRNKERFIRTRATEIKILIPSAEWRHIRTKENPADIASRGICASKLINNTLWWHGPTWLANPKEEWPKDDQIDGSAVIITTLNTNHISKEELDTARNEIIRQHQLTHFAAEISSINQGKEINRISKLIHLRPFIDKNGLLRVGGRLQNATIKYNQMHPIILHRDQYAELIIYQAHQSTLHGGQNLMEAHIKQQYWILGVRKGIKKICNNCTKCIRYSQNFGKQIMGYMPSHRINVSHPFEHTGIDYAGPIYMKCSKGRGQKSFKGYISVFICMSTKAIHLEAVSDLSTEAFMAALKRFFSRRGKSAHLYSDNGTNFIDALKRLDKEFGNAIKNNTSIVQILATEKIEWHFIPPASPHFGGIWEAAVKSTKYHLKRVIAVKAITNSSGASIHKLNDKTALYLDTIGEVNTEISAWNLILYYDMKQYFIMTKNAEDVLSNANEICPKLSNFAEQCKNILSTMSRKLEEIKEGNKLFIWSIKGRTKRAPFAFVGSFYHLLFGMMDEDDRNALEENMNNLLDNQHDLKQLIAKQTSVVETTVNLLKRTSKEVQLQYNEIRTKIEAIKIALNETYFVYKESINFFMVTKQLSDLIEECSNIQSE
ncbi:uncharacterized protein LOC119664701, partial [Teleopsis dalmanni]|uniref:uncharacterized protein LOC119664701 n=1 Tax=Teleopsis dalmanni TaxID=139649 RepID=UPI0018CF24C1